MEYDSIAPRSTRECPRDTRLLGRLEEVVKTHFDPKWGSPYWLEKARDLGLDGCRDLRTPEDLRVFGAFEEADLARRSVWDFLPRSYHDRLAEFVVGETGGTLGRPKKTAYLESDFLAAFVAPFLAATDEIVSFPRGLRWAWIGPGGPHLIGKAARAVCHAVGSPDPFAVDFDPRWFRAQAPGSLGRRRYLEHVVQQALAILETEPVEVLFSTPPVLLRVGERLRAAERERVEGVHLGGLPLDGADGKRLREYFPRAAFLSGYGNSLLGMCPQLEPDSPDGPTYYPYGSRLDIRVAPRGEDGKLRLDAQVSYGERGRIIATRLDRSFLIIGLVERDEAVRMPPHPDGIRFGFFSDGLRSPGPAAALAGGQTGIY